MEIQPSQDKLQAQGVERGDVAGEAGGRRKKNKTSRSQKRRKRRHLCAAPVLLPLLLLQLRVLHSQLEAGQLGHERLVTHMERVRDRELQRSEGGSEIRREEETEE